MHLSTQWLRLLSGGGSVVVDLLFIVTPIVGVCNCSMFCCTLLYVHSSVALILVGKRELVALLSLSSWCLLIVVYLFREMPWFSLHNEIVVFPDHTHLLFNTNFFKYLSLPYNTILRSILYQLFQHFGQT